MNNSGKIPIYIDGKQIRNYDDNTIDKVIENSFIQQYNKKDVERFKQTDLANRIIILDNLHQCKLNTDYKSKFLDKINKCYKSIIIFSHLSFELEAISDKSMYKSLSTYDLYRITEYGHVLRDSLIDKWILLGQDDTLSMIELHARKDEISNTINVAIGNNVIPRYPIYLITLLQAFEAGSSTSLSGSAYGHYYHYLIVQALSLTKVKPENLDFYFSFLSHLAFNSFIRNQFHYMDSSMNEFYQKFIQLKKITSNEIEHFSKLKKANLLTHENSTYSFSHNYIYYFFVSKYLADNIEDEEITDIIVNLTQRLYRMEFANIIIFLIHHSKKTFIIEKILKEAQVLFSDFSPMTFSESETRKINGLIDKDFIFKLKDKKAQTARTEELKEKDNYEEAHPIVNDRGEARQDEEVFILNTFEKINLSRKLMKILGQIAKNYYTSLDGNTKYELVDETIKLGMRSLGSFIKDMEAHTDLLLTNIETVIKRKSIVEQDKIQELCNGILFNFTTLISCSFITQTSKSIVSKNLTPIFDSIYADNAFISTKLINIASQLNFSDGLNVDDISNFYKKIKGNRMVESMLRLLVMNHLYMFDIVFSKRQSICSKIGIVDEKTSQQALFDKRLKIF